MDEAGEFPEKIKRGVLSQDGIWNMLERNKELTRSIGIAAEDFLNMEKTSKHGFRI